MKLRLAPDSGRAVEVMVKALKPASKTIVSRTTLSTTSTLVWLDMPKVATSWEPSGTVAGVQLAAVFHSLVVGLRFHVALSAKAAFSAPSASVRMMAQDRMGDFMAPIMPTAPVESK